MSKKLLLIGSDSVHIYHFYELIESYFDEIVLITTQDSKFEKSKISRKYTINSSLKNPLNYVFATKKLRKILLREKPDIIHVQQIATYHFLILRANRNFNIPVVGTAWGSDILLNPEKGFLYKKMVQYCLNHTDFLTADAQYIADKMQQLASKSLSITVANFGIEVEPYSIKKENIIYSNRLLNKLYRIDSIIEAFAIFVQQKPYQDWQLIIAGTGSEEENLKQKVKDLKLTESVHFVGWLKKEENLSWYAKAKIWIAFPESDATSISLLEAMSMQCIPIITDLPATREWITDHDNGLLVNNLSSFQLEKAFSLNIDELIKKNTEMIQNRATKIANSQKFISIYQSIFSKNHEQ